MHFARYRHGQRCLGGAGALPVESFTSVGCVFAISWMFVGACLGLGGCANPSEGPEAGSQPLQPVSARGTEHNKHGSAPARTPALSRQNMPHPAPQNRRGDPAARNAECEDCHPRVAEQWRNSLHARAFTVPEFRRAFRLEPLGFCRGCHAPEAGPRPDETGESIGVACITCHLVDDELVLTGPVRAGSDVAEPPHPLRREARFGSSDACAGCHEFAFPGRAAGDERMQTTVSEHRDSQQADRSCADCHMPQGASGERSHGFHASRDSAWMQSVVDVQATRPRGDKLVITLELDKAAIGHALPTGDLFRRIAVEAISTRKQVRPTTKRRILARHWAPRTGGQPSEYTVVADDRLGVGDNPRVVHLSLEPEDEALPVRWKVRYERVEAMLLGATDEGMVVGGVLLAEGVLNPPV